jgi:lipopolysaccharide/colanic/teichoic acid biosynthesis glycosyltransferase
MSLVGPRMITPPELEKYGPLQTKLLIAKPGMTGVWQVKGRQTVPYVERVNMDMFYIDSWSIWLDLYLLILTLCKVPGGQGAY